MWTPRRLNDSDGVDMRVGLEGITERQLVRRAPANFAQARSDARNENRLASRFFGDLPHGPHRAGVNGDGTGGRSDQRIEAEILTSAGIGGQGTSATSCSSAFMTTSSIVSRRWRPR
jgi:hypothetical protein